MEVAIALSSFFFLSCFLFSHTRKGGGHPPNLLKKNKKNIMQFAAFMYDEVEGGLGKEALDTVLPYDQMQVLTESKEYLSKHLVFGVQLGVTIYDLNAGGDVPGDAKKIGLAEPGKPSMSLAPLDA